MKAAVCYENGPPSVLKYEDVADPSCGPNEVLIKTAAVSVEGGDTLSRFRGALATRPHIVGYQAAGEIMEVGAEVKHLKPGQRVATVDNFGSHAELRVAPARNVWPVPDGFDLKLAAAIPIIFGTADDCLFEFGHLKAGETVLVQAGASGVGIAAIQLAKRAGATVLATASSDARLARLEPLGIDHGINYMSEDLVPAVMQLTGNKGVDLVIDPVGGTVLQSSILVAGHRGRIVLVGAAAREPSQIDAGKLMGGSRSLTGVFLAAEITTDRVHDNIQRLVEEAARGELGVVIDRTYPLSEAAAAHAYIESRQAVGRVLLIP
ncbi:MAG TPA: zinc-binding alcohol dehydrogenase family protein [Stellaceae bacterium]|nr:zinc-binding alcohol dehydrogenase family protein [Stellaceae bacterium]